MIFLNIINNFYKWFNIIKKLCLKIDEKNKSNSIIRLIRCKYICRTSSICFYRMPLFATRERNYPFFKRNRKCAEVLPRAQEILAWDIFKMATNTSVWDSADCMCSWEGHLLPQSQILTKDISSCCWLISFYWYSRQPNCPFSLNNIKLQITKTTSYKKKKEQQKTEKRMWKIEFFGQNTFE